MSDADRLWATCAEALRAQVSEAVWHTWFAGVRTGSSADGELVLVVPNLVIRERIEHRYLPMVRDVLDEAGASGLTVRFEVTPPAAPNPVADDGFSIRRAEQAGSGPPGANRTKGDRPGGGGWEGGRDENGAVRASGEVPLNPSFSFEAFVIGDSNRFPHAAARSVAETPGRSYNPLFVHGAAGLGKTHLLHAIGNYVRQHFPGKHVRYVSTETFMNEFVDAIRGNQPLVFKRRYREVDVLLVDDIQFMEGKEALQEEFFHTFNSLQQSNSQIVLTCDKPPKGLGTLEERLVSRFASGLVCDVQPPDLETRLAILRKKAEGELVQPPGEVLELIASHVKDNIRELEGALTRVIAFSSLSGQTLTMELAESILSDILTGNEPRRITPQVILDATSAMFGFSKDELCGPSRRRPLVTARQISMYVFRNLTDFSYPAIAREFGGRDHTTVIHAYDKIDRLMKEKRQIYDQVTELIHLIRSGG